MNLFEKFHIETDNEDLYEIAFTHSSYGIVHNLNYTYERLEFLGDSILSLIVTEYLYKKYPQYGEGNLTKLRANYVCQNALIHYSNELNLRQYLKVCPDELNLSDNEIISITADVVESFLGAMFLDQGIDFTRNFISEVIFKYIDAEKVFFKDYKSQLKEYGDSNELYIEYNVLEESGVPHDKIFKVVCLLNNQDFGIGVGKNKKEAEQVAAKETLNKLKSGESNE